MKLEVAKTVIGGDEDCDELFTFEIQVRADEESEWSEGFEFQLSHDLAFEFTIPYGYQYRVTENDYSKEGYLTTVSVDGEEAIQSLVCEGTILEAERVDFVNEKIVAVKTGDEPRNDTCLNVMFLGLGIALIMGILAIKRKLEA